MLSPVRRVVASSSVVELGVGIALIVAPAVVLGQLSGKSAPDDWLPLGRCFGVAILTLGIACWPEPRHPERGAPAFRALLAYNMLIALYLTSLGVAGEWSGPFLWLGVALHAVVWMALILAWRDVTHRARAPLRRAK